jgi:predicted RNase H-like nuclease (RuvC/YqgF family)
MGETAADTRREIERARSELGRTIDQLRARTLVIRGRVIRSGVVAAGAAVTAGLAAAGFVRVRRSRGGSIAKAARRLPAGTHPATIPAALATERWMARRSKRLAQQREDLITGVSKRIAENQAEAQRRANPLWRRTAAKALETAVTIGASALIRRVMSDRRESAHRTCQGPEVAEGDASIVASDAAEARRRQPAPA